MQGHERLLLYFIMFEVTWGLGKFFHFLYFQDGIHNFGICANKSCGHSPQRRHFRPQEFGETWHWLGHGENTWPRRWSEAGRYHVNHRVGNPSPDKERVNVLICNSDSKIESWWIDWYVPWKKTIIKSLKANLNSLIVFLEWIVIIAVHTKKQPSSHAFLLGCKNT